MEIRFIADVNVGKLAKWLRIMGYDTLFFKDIDDGELVEMALAENRVLLTRDTDILKRRVVASGRVQAILIADDRAKNQLSQVIDTLNLKTDSCFSRCIECNQLLEDRAKRDVEKLVPSYVFKTQLLYMQCPSCDKVYWRGTHWDRMDKELKDLGNGG
jgi:uncharacterized protein with PIN domain